MVYSMAPFPFPQLAELREKYTYNITPFTAATMNAVGSIRQPSSSGGGSGSVINNSGNAAGHGAVGSRHSDDEWEDDEVLDNVNCFAGFFPPQQQLPSPSNASKRSKYEQFKMYSLAFLLY